MKKIIFTNLSPNAEKDDILRALNLLVRPWSWNKNEYSEKVRNWFADYLNHKNVFLTDSGRTALMLALLAMKIEEGDEVLVQAYTCVAVPNSILWVKAKPVFVDIVPETLNIDLNDARKKISDKTKAIIVQHTFGNPADMDMIMQFAKENNLKVIEDCAHGLGAKFNGKMLGSFGDMAIFSFGRDKVVSAVFGGAVAVKDEVLADKLREEYDKFPTVGKIWTLRQLLHPIIFFLAKATYDIGPVGKIIIELAKRFGLIAKAVYSEERRAGKPNFTSKKLNNALSKLAYFQLLKLSRFLDHRRNIAEIYRKKIVIPNVLTQLIISKAEPGYLRYFLSVDDSDSLFNYAKMHGVLLGDWYRQVIAPREVLYDKIGYVEGSCVNAEKQAKRSINLPTHIGINREKAETIACLINNFYDRNTNN